MRAAVLDLGSNSFHLLVADLEEHDLVPLRRVREMLHLGRAVERHGSVPEGLHQRAVATVERMTDLARRSGALTTIAVATEVFRAAPDRALLVDLENAAGTAIRVLDAAEEGSLAHLGATASVGLERGSDPVVVLDLGGGSLELALGRAGTTRWTTSLPLGASRMTANPVLSSVRDGALSEDEVEALGRHIGRTLAPAARELRRRAPGRVLAVGGIVRAVARTFAAQERLWLPATVNRLEIDTGSIEDLADRLLSMTDAERAALPGVSRKRADHIHIGALVLARTLRALAVDQVTVSDWGLREGVLLTSIDGRALGSSELREREVDRLRRAFSGTDPHPGHVAHLAGELFDRTRRVHELMSDDRELLVHAASLHAVGSALALRRQQDHGAYIIEHAELRGFDPDRLAILATLVRFHPSRGTSLRYPPLRSLDEDARDRTARLLVLLQLAHALDVLHDQRVTLRSVRRSGDDLIIEVDGASSPSLERALLDRSPLAREVMGVTPVLRAGGLG